MLPCQQTAIVSYSHHLARSYQLWTGKILLDHFSPEALYNAPFALVSHGIEADPIFCYANLTAQKLWNMDWRQFTALPSRLSAQPDARGERERLLALAQENGYVADYQGIRIASDGKRFAIKNCLLWNVLDEKNIKIGQAACFDQWEWLDVQ